ncbi:MAG: Basal-body rod modification protein FlgD [Burkholderia gladioli]|nr:MAG: Basal-body rod modification protein FlgD [Burkholderia gladioli]
MSASSTTIGNNGTPVNRLPPDTMHSKGAPAQSATDLQQTFLKLLVTQLQNQDPTSPVDSAQMTSQLAQINTVSGIAQLNASLASLASQVAAGQATQAAALVGANVLAPGSTLSVSKGAPVGFGVQLTSAAANLTITVKDATGKVVGTLDEGAQKAGTVPLTWRPVDASGATLPDGRYTIGASYTNAQGATASATTLTLAQVQGVIRQADGSAGLALSNGATVDLARIGAILPRARGGTGSHS